MKENKSMSIKVGTAEHSAGEVLKMIEGFSVGLSLGKKDALHLRLIAEELIGFPKVLFDANSCQLTAASAGNGAELSVRVDPETVEASRKLVVDKLSDGVNSAYSGFTGMLKRAVDSMISSAADAPPIEHYGNETRFDSMIYDENRFEWSMERYKQKAELEKKAEEYDALELSILAKLADNVVVYARPHRTEITVRYLFRGE